MRHRWMRGQFVSAGNLQRHLVHVARRHITGIHVEFSAILLIKQCQSQTLRAKELVASLGQTQKVASRASVLKRHPPAKHQLHQAIEIEATSHDRAHKRQQPIFVANGNSHKSPIGAIARVTVRHIINELAPLRALRHPPAQPMSALNASRQTAFAQITRAVSRTRVAMHAIKQFDMQHSNRVQRRGQHFVEPHALEQRSLFERQKQVRHLFQLNQFVNARLQRCAHSKCSRVNAKLNLSKRKSKEHLVAPALLI